MRVISLAEVASGSSFARRYYAKAGSGGKRGNWKNDLPFFSSEISSRFGN